MSETFSLFIDNLTVLDCAILDPQRGPIGMSWLVDVEFIGGLTKDGVVFDFSLAKKEAKKTIDFMADHAFIVPEADAIIGNGEVLVQFTGGVYRAPQQSIFTVEQVTPNYIASAIECLILNNCRSNLEIGNLKQVKITLKEQKCDDVYYYHYTHGLKDHFGNCQRLMHGHKSMITISVNGKRDKALEKEVSDMFYDTHIAYDKYVTNNQNNTYTIGYVGSQGEFSLTLPIENVIILPYETTVENISKYIAHWIKNHHPDLVDATLTVKAYEGIDKGCSYTLIAGKHQPESVVIQPKLELLKG